MENILTDYRSANRFKGVKDGKAVIEPGKPFLLDSEKSDAPQPLSFELVRETFQHEYRRLAAESGTLIKVEAPRGGERKKVTPTKFGGVGVLA